MVPHVCNTLLNVTGLETDINLGFITYICTHSHKHPSSGESLLYNLLNILNFFFNNFIYLFWSVLGLHCCTGFSLVVASRCYSLATVRMLLIEMASLLMEHRLLGCTGFSSCDTPAQLLRGMQDLLGSGIEPVSPALAAGFFTTEPPRKP